MELPELLVMRVRAVLHRRGGGVTRGLVSAEIARRLRVSFAIEDLMAEGSDENGSEEASE